MKDSDSLQVQILSGKSIIIDYRFYRFSIIIEIFEIVPEKLNIVAKATSEGCKTTKSRGEA